jgi:hypothetical protein
MKFYDCKTAPSARRVRMFLAEKGVEIETVENKVKKPHFFEERSSRVIADAQSNLGLSGVMILFDGQSRQWTRSAGLQAARFTAAIYLILGATSCHQKLIDDFGCVLLCPRKWR